LQKTKPMKKPVNRGRALRGRGERTGRRHQERHGGQNKNLKLREKNYKKGKFLAKSRKKGFDISLKINAKKLGNNQCVRRGKGFKRTMSIWRRGAKKRIPSAVKNGDCGITEVLDN